MSKKASIITFHCVPNYGAVLQAYALQETLKDYFENVEIINYCPNTLLDEYKIINFYSIFSVVATLWSSVSYKRKCKKFLAFSKIRLRLSQTKGSTLDDFVDYKTDYVFVGSDQIWNPDITGGFDNVYFGKLSTVFKPIIVSYAASIGKSLLNDDEIEQMGKLIQGVDFISVREPEAQTLIDSSFHRESDVVVDPTILAGRDCFQGLVSKIDNKPYVLLYSLNGYSETESMAEKIARYLRLDLIELSGKRKPFFKKNHRSIYDAGPEEFVSYIANAQYVVTDSFHGTVFSLLFHKNMITIPHKTRGGRTRNLMSIAGLNDRLMDTFDRDVIERVICWEKVDEKLAVEREKARHFIERVISNENK